MVSCRVVLIRNEALRLLVAGTRVRRLGACVRKTTPYAPSLVCRDPSTRNISNHSIDAPARNAHEVGVDGMGLLLVKGTHVHAYIHTDATIGRVTPCFQPFSR